MTNRIITNIASGNLKLMISETVCFNPLDGLKIQIPTTNEQTGQSGNPIIFNFSFTYEQDQSNREININISDDNISIGIPNFGGPLISGLTKPLTFQFGEISIVLFFTGMLLTNESEHDFKLMQFTVSIYKREI